MWMNVLLTMVGVLTSVPTRMDPLCAAVELDSPWPVMDEAVMVRRGLLQVISTREGKIGIGGRRGTREVRNGE